MSYTIEGRNGELARELRRMAALPAIPEGNDWTSADERFGRALRVRLDEFADALSVQNAAPASTQADRFGEQPTFFEMARTITMRSRIETIVAAHDAFIAATTEENAFTLKRAVDSARGIGITDAERQPAASPAPEHK